MIKWPVKLRTFFNVFLRFFQNPKKHDFLRFFEWLTTFSRTLGYANRKMIADKMVFVRRMSSMPKIMSSVTFTRQQMMRAIVRPLTHFFIMNSNYIGSLITLATWKTILTCQDAVDKSVTSWQQVVVMKFGKRRDTTDTTDFCPRQLVTDLLR